jgi:hypothetical protein
VGKHLHRLRSCHLSTPSITSIAVLLWSTKISSGAKVPTLPK